MYCEKCGEGVGSDRHAFCGVGWMVAYHPGCCPGENPIEGPCEKCSRTRLSVPTMDDAEDRTRFGYRAGPVEVDDASTMNVAEARRLIGRTIVGVAAHFSHSLTLTLDDGSRIEVQSLGMDGIGIEIQTNPDAGRS
jgi:hypothetical protein